MCLAPRWPRCRWCFVGVTVPGGLIPSSWPLLTPVSQQGRWRHPSKNWTRDTDAVLALHHGIAWKQSAQHRLQWAASETRWLMWLSATFWWAWPDTQWPQAHARLSRRCPRQSDATSCGLNYSFVCSWRSGNARSGRVPACFKSATAHIDGVSSGSGTRPRATEGKNKMSSLWDCSRWPTLLGGPTVHRRHH